MPYDDDRRNNSPRKESAPYFEVANPDNIQLQMNPTMAGHVSSLILDAFEDGDPPAIFAFAKRLEKFAGGAGRLDSHAEDDVLQSV